MTRDEWQDFVRDVHENAVEHGFWDDHGPDTKFALIHCEWSEAMDEYRRDRPMMYYGCDAWGREICDSTCIHNHGGVCAAGAKNSKPEGVAVELIDGCLRLLDMAVHLNLDIEPRTDVDFIPLRLPWLIMDLHEQTQKLYKYSRAIHAEGVCIVCIRTCIEMCFAFIRAQGIDPEAIMIVKHEYNKSRPYLHGKKC